MQQWLALQPVNGQLQHAGVCANCTNTLTRFACSHSIWHNIWSWPCSANSVDQNLASCTNKQIGSEIGRSTCNKQLHTNSAGKHTQTQKKEHSPMGIDASTNPQDWPHCFLHPWHQRPIALSLSVALNRTWQHSVWAACPAGNWHLGVMHDCTLQHSCCNKPALPKL